MTQHQDVEVRSGLGLELRASVRVKTRKTWCCLQLRAEDSCLVGQVPWQEIKTEGWTEAQLRAAMDAQDTLIPLQPAACQLALPLCI